MSLLYGITHPDDIRHRIWDIVVGGTVILSLVLIPLMLAFNLANDSFFFALDVFINLIFIFDIWVSLRTAFYDGSMYVSDAKSIRSRYLKTWFWPDLLAAFPYFLLPGGITVVNRLFRFLRLLRVIKIFSLFRLLNRIRGFRLSVNIIRLCIMAFWLFMCAHYIACGFILVGGISKAGTLNEQYILAFYWSITTLATVGFGDITPSKESMPQLLFTIFAMVSGVGMYGYVIGSVSSVINNIDLAKTQFMEQVEKINSFLRYRKISEHSIAKVNRYYDYLWETRRGFDEARVLRDLPPSIRIDLAREIHRDLIEKVPLFANASPALLRDVILALEPQVYTPGDWIMRKNDPGEDMLFINRGIVQILDEKDNTVIASLGEGAYVGEMSLLFGAARTASVRAQTYCDLYSLSKVKFDQILPRHPEFAASVYASAEARRKGS